MTAMTFYWIGYGICFLAHFLHLAKKEEITLADIFFGLFGSILSWILIAIWVFYFMLESPNIVVWRKKKLKKSDG